VQPYDVIEGKISEGCVMPARINKHVCFTILGLLFLTIGIIGMAADPCGNDDRGTIAIEVDLDPPFETKSALPPSVSHAVLVSAEPVAHPLEFFASVSPAALPSQESTLPPLAVPLRL
jgi:hypothetical protein